MAKGKHKERQQLATPYEAAQLAVSLAIMRGEQKPDLAGAVELLKNAARRIQDEKCPRVLYPTAIYDESGRFKPPHPSSNVISPSSHPAEWRAHLEQLKSFPGADQIRKPKGDDFTILQIAAAVTGRKEKARNMDVFQRMIAQLKLGQETMTFVYAGESAFWSMAERLAPFASRFRHLYPQPNATKRRSVKGQFIGMKKDGKGRFQKKRKK